MANRKLMNGAYDVIVLGLGAMGSAAAYHLAARGKQVLGLEQFTAAHDRGSSHGHSRIIRQAYFEDPAYVPLLMRAYELWRRIEHESATRLLTITGGLMIGGPDTPVVAGSLRSAQEHELPHELLDATDIARRFPPFKVQPGTVALWEKQAGVVRPEAAVRAHLRRAADLGAELRFEEPVLRWNAASSHDRVEVVSACDTYTAERLVVAPGAWAPDVLAGLGLPLQVERQVQFWFDPVGGVEPFLPEYFPIYIWDTGDDPPFYGFPAMDGAAGGVKVAFHHGGATCTADTLDRTIYPDEVARIRAAIATYVPALAGPLREAIPCMYTNTPDEHFVVARHPQRSQVLIAAGFSGHGFKFAPVVGEILADLAITGSTSHPIGLFNPERFGHVVGRAI